MDGPSKRQLRLRHGSDNVAAIGFASSFGFRPADEHRGGRVAEGAPEQDNDDAAVMLRS